MSIFLVLLLGVRDLQNLRKLECVCMMPEKGFGLELTKLVSR
jgi:hypothetical protein